jgi:hypothetical protein
MTNRTQAQDDGLILTGLDGSNPLAFLAALGTLRTLSLACPDRKVKMGWTQHGGAWRPVITADGELTPGVCLSTLEQGLGRMTGHLAFTLGDNLNVSAQDFRGYAVKTTTAHSSREATERIAADFAAAFACDALVNEQMTVQDTALRTMSGAGHQHFLASMRHIISVTQVMHIERALFHPWKYDDPIAKQSLRWDPLEDRQYALQWRDPSGDPTRTERGTMLGANRLAIEGIPMITCAPEGKTLRTAGFSGRGARETFWSWPIWSTPIPLDVCYSLLACSLLTHVDQSAIPVLKSMGIQSVFRSQRITTGKFRNFTPAVALL